MGKSNKTFWTAASVILAIVVIGVSLVDRFVWAQADVKAADTKIDATASSLNEKIETVKEEGCLPARAADKSIVVIESKITSIDDRFQRFETEQTTRHTQILNAIKGKPAPP